MRDQFSSIPTELEEAALVDGLSIWGAFTTIIMPIALPGMVAAFILSLVLTWNEYFFAALLTSSHAKTLPVMVASQTGSQGISWWSMAALSFAAILPLIVIAIILERYIIKVWLQVRLSKLKIFICYWEPATACATALESS